VHAPFGAHPTSNPPAYGWDMDHFKKYTGLAGEEGGWAKYVEEFLSGTEADYLAKVGGAERLSTLKPPIF
jgi:glutaconate CoA-transferase subunit A